MPFLIISCQGHLTGWEYFPFISDRFDPATDQKGNAMAKSHYQFKKRQKELAKKKKQEEKRKNKLANNAAEAGETEKDPTAPPPEDLEA